MSGGKSNYDRSSDGNIMFHKFSLVTGVGIGVLLAPVSCWCPRGRLAPLCYASLAGDGLLVATHRHRPPATHKPKIQRFYQTLFCVLFLSPLWLLGSYYKLVCPNPYAYEESPRGAASGLTRCNFFRLQTSLLSFFLVQMG